MRKNENDRVGRALRHLGPKIDASLVWRVSHGVWAHSGVRAALMWGVKRSVLRPFRSIDRALGRPAPVFVSPGISSVERSISFFSSANPPNDAP